jgi:hypothetical protein
MLAMDVAIIGLLALGGQRQDSARLIDDQIGI